jgi:hypothetical protein
VWGAMRGDGARAGCDLKAPPSVARNFSSLTSLHHHVMDLLQTVRKEGSR